MSVDFDASHSVLITSVEDTGIGMTSEDLVKLFKFFGQISKTKDINRAGMGLGLTISKMIIRQLGGEIAVTSEPDLGSKFTFSIPVEKQESTGVPLSQENLLRVPEGNHPEA